MYYTYELNEDGTLSRVYQKEGTRRRTVYVDGAPDNHKLSLHWYERSWSQNNMNDEQIVRFEDLPKLIQRKITENLLGV